MPKRLLVTRPEHDDTTKYLSCYAKLVIKYADDNDIAVKDFEAGTVTRKEVTKFIEKQHPRLLFLNGHGDEDSIEGEKGERIFKKDTNDTLLKDKITYARACYAAISLGKKCVEFGENTCFIGYNIPFSFWIDESWSANPLKDKTASLYLEPSNELVKFLIKGDKVKEAVEKSQNLIIKNMGKLLKQKREPWAVQKLKVLWNNYEGREVCGNDEISF